jgi:hypothetical protein
MKKRPRFCKNRRGTGKGRKGGRMKEIKRSK